MWRRSLVMALCLGGHAALPANQIPSPSLPRPMSAGVPAFHGEAFSGDIRERVMAGAAHIQEEYRRLFGFDFSEEVGVRVRIFDDFSSFKDYQRTNSSSTSDSAYYHNERKEIVAWNRSSQELLRAVLHEYSHFLLRHQVARPPKWVNEGLAEYYEFLRAEDFFIGVQPLKWNRCRSWGKSGALRSLPTFLTLTDDEWKSLNEEGNKEASSLSWALVYFMMSNDAGRRALRAILWEMKKSSPVDSIGLLNRFYDGGVPALEQGWRDWLSSSGA